MMFRSPLGKSHVFCFQGANMWTEYVQGSLVFRCSGKLFILYSLFVIFLLIFSVEFLFIRHWKTSLHKLNTSMKCI